jgi:Lrp/AsnC family transcriptional regulator, leucine-responsive regulatory protein
MKDTLIAFVFMQTDYLEDQPATLLARMPEVEELHRIAGEECYVIRVRVSSTDQLGRLRDRIEQLKGVRATRTTVVLKTLKDKAAPLGPRSAASWPV